MSLSKDMNILELPEEVLVTIFRHLPDRTSYSMVCKTFHKIICLIAINKQITITDQDLMFTPHFIQDLPNYLKTIEVKYSEHTVEFIERFGKLIYNFQSYYTFALQYVPNCRVLTLYPYDECENEFPIHLPFLKQFSTRIDSESDFVLIKAILQQCQLDSFECASDQYTEHDIVGELFKCQKNLKQLSLKHFKSIFDCEFDLQNLKILSFNIVGNAAEYNCNGFEKLTSLEELELSFSQDCQNFPLFSESKLSKISALSISNYTSYLTTSLVENLSRSACNLKTFKIFDYRIELKAIKEILKSFKCLKELVIYNQYNELLNNVNWSSCYNENLKHLTLKFGPVTQYDAQTISNINGAFPNLIELFINGRFYSTQQSESNEKETVNSESNQALHLYHLLIQNIERGSRIDCLLNTNKRFSKVNIAIGKDVLVRQENFNQIFQFFSKQRFITEMIVIARMTPSQFWQLISSIPMCKKLKLVSGLKYDDHELDHRYSGEIEEFHSVGAHAESLDILTKLFETQRKLKKVVLEDFKFDSDILNNFLESCNLIHFEWSTYDFRDDRFDEKSKDTITEIIAKQRDLKVLRINFKTWPELFLEITRNCKNLEYLEYCGAGKLTEESFARIQNLKFLTSLNLACEKELSEENLKSFMRTFTKLNLKKLKLVNLAGGIPEGIFKQLADSNVNLKRISIHSMWIRIRLCSVLQHFKNIEEFEIEYLGDITTSYEEEFFYNLSLNTNMRVLSAIGDGAILSLADIRNFLTAYPCLEQLKIKMKSDMDNISLGYEPFIPLEATQSELTEILQIGRSLKHVYITGLRINDYQGFSECELQQRFKVIEYYLYGSGETFELLLTSDIAAVEKVMESKHEFNEPVFKKAYERLSLINKESTT